MRYFIRLSYDGSAFCGWQIQENATSVQEVLQNAFSVLLKKPLNITGCGRTDTGVNAVNYIAHFDSMELPLQGNIIYKLNAILPKEIVVHSIFLVPDNAHARFDACARTYRYYLHTVKDPFANRYSLYWPYRELDFDKMNRAAQMFIGEQDFSSLEKVNGGNKTSVCNVTEAFWEREREGHYIFTVTANRFLRNMVRAMVGSLLEVGSGKRELQWIEEMMRSRNRCKAGASVPGNALFLYRIQYNNIEIV